MTTETKAAIALAAGTNLRRVLLAGLAVIALTSCGGGGGGSEEASPNQTGPTYASVVTIEGPTGGPTYTTEEREMVLRGSAYIIPQFYNPQWDSCNSRAGVRVSWRNAAGGGGAAEQPGGCIDSSGFIDDNSWTALIPLVIGENVITVTAADSSGNNMVEDTITITRLSLPETTSPHTVSSTDPTNGATNVSVNSEITAQFSGEMASWSITERTFLLVDYRGAPVSGTVSSPFGNVARFDPAAPLWTDWTYTATITTRVRDLSGNAMASAHSWTFTTERYRR